MAECRTDRRAVMSARERRERFLEHLALTGNVSEASRMAEIQRGTLYRWREEHADFSKLWDYALDEAADALEAEARRRAIIGYDEPITYGGKPVCDPETGSALVRRKYSDGLMAFLLRAHRPARFRDTEREGMGVSITISRDDSEL